MQSLKTDERLVAQAASGDQRALTAIFKRYHQELYRYCGALLGNSEDAADALQNTMVKVLGALPGERRRVHLKPWLYRIAHNESVELIRRRQDLDPIDPDALVGAAGPETSAETRERLRQLIADLRQLPERQRGALLMRELSGLSFEQIGAAFDTSDAVARQTVYEARVGLREMERGREMGCSEVRGKLSDGDRRVFRRRDVRAHLRHCAACREFEESISERRANLAAISPLPALAAAGLLQGVLGGAAGSTGAAAGAGAAGGAGAVGVGSAISASAAVKAVATLAVVGAVGVGAADRTGLAKVFPGGDAGNAPASTGGTSAGGAPATESVRATDKVGGPSSSGGQGSANSRAEGKGVGNSKAQAAPGARAGSRGPSSAGNGNQGHGTAKSKGGGSVNAHGANPNAKGGNPNAKGGNPNAKGGNRGDPSASNPGKGNPPAAKPPSANPPAGKPPAGNPPAAKAPPAKPPPATSSPPPGPPAGKAQAPASGAPGLSQPQGDPHGGELPAHGKPAG